MGMPTMLKNVFSRSIVYPLGVIAAIHMVMLIL